MRSAGRSPSTERVRMQAKRTLDAAGTTQPIGKGEVKGNARRTCPRSQSGKTDAGRPETEAVSGQARRARSR
jgi:hypothetical protein